MVQVCRAAQRHFGTGCVRTWIALRQLELPPASLSKARRHLRGFCHRGEVAASAGSLLHCSIAVVLGLAATYAQPGALSDPAQIGGI
jgi:hypothetical protein